MDYLAVASRWTHIASMTFLVGSAMYSAWVVAPALAGADGSRLSDRITERVRGWVIAAVAALLVSGAYNLLRKANLPAGYHMWFGIKMLFALHIIAVSVLMGKAGVSVEKRSKWAQGIAASGLVVLLISAYLRGMQQ